MQHRAFNDPIVDCCERDAADCDCEIITLVPNGPPSPGHVWATKSATVLVQDEDEDNWYGVPPHQQRLPRIRYPKYAWKKETE